MLKSHHSPHAPHAMSEKIFYLYKSACIQAVKKNLATRVEWCSMHMVEFDADSKPITVYLESVELFFEANDVGNGKHVPILLSNIRAYKCIGCSKA